MSEQAHFRTRGIIGCMAAILWLALAAASPSARAADAPPTPADLHKMFDDGQYSPLVAKLTKIISLGSKNQDYDLVELGLLKAEALVAVKQQEAALRATNEAIGFITKDTPKKQIPDLQGLHTLLLYARNNQYMPRHLPDGTKGTSIGLDLASRKEVYTALLADLRIDVEAKIDAAKTARTLPSINAAIALLNDMSPVEQIITNKDADSHRKIDSLCDQAVTLMDDALTPLAKSVGELKDRANQIIEIQIIDGFGNLHIQRSKRGLINGEPAELRSAFTTCDKIRTACDEFARLTPRRTKDFKPLFTTADKTAKDADKLLKQFKR